MKICLISQNAFPGLLVFRVDLIRYLVTQGYEVYAFAIDYRDDSKKAIEALGAVPVEYSLNKTGLNPFGDLRDIFALASKLKKISPDVVFSFFVKPSIYGTLAARVAKVPRRIAMLEGLGYIHTPLENGYSVKKRLLQLAHGILSSIGFLFADKVLFLNHDDPVDLCKFAFINKNKIKILGPIGLSLDQYPLSPVPKVSKSVCFIFVARLLVEKGIFEFIDAARSVKKAHPSTEFIVLGGLDSDNPSALSKVQLELLIKDNIITYPGHVSDVYRWIEKAHVFVLPSYREGFPRSTQEAMAIGRAIITTDVPGCRETVLDDRNGFLVPAFNSEALAVKMRHLIEHSEKLLVMGEESHRIAKERFDVDKINLLIESILIGDAK